MKKGGIEQVVDVSYNPKITDISEQAGLKYFYLDLMDFKNNCLPKNFSPAKYRKDYNFRQQRKYIDDFVNFIQLMQKERVFLCSSYFSDGRLDLAVRYDYLFNPKAQHDPKTSVDVYRYKGDVKDIYNALTDSDKLKMGWTKQFDKEFLQRLKQLRI